MLNLLNTVFPNPLKIFKLVVSVLITLAILYSFWLIGVNLYSWWRYRPSKVVERFSLVLQNSTDRITEEEKKILADITDSNFVSNFFKQQERQVLELREFVQGNPIQIGPIEYENKLKSSAKVELTFNNNFTNPESKKAILYLQRTGDWYLLGQRWKIYEIQMPSKPNPVKNVQEDLNKGAEDLKQRARQLLDNLFPKQKQEENK